MVSLWPFKGEDNSPAEFEKTLATLSTKITQTTARLDLHRQHARRFKALWTLYTSFIYLLYSVILALVLGWENWGVKEYAAIVGGPVVIYIVRAAGTKYFDYRISHTQRYLDSLSKQRDETIEKLKVATKYNSTQQLLEKYGGDSPSGKQRSKSGDGKPKEGKRKTSQPQQQQQQQQQPVQRTGLPPPPTANIRRPPPPQSPEQPPSPYPQSPEHPHSPQPQSPPSQFPVRFPPPVDEPGFAPNAFPSQQYIEHSRWYDRLLDVLLGEDETQPKNRTVLICSTCRLVNGQAPPGVKSLEELGRWRCGGCGAWNGEESAAKKALADIKASGPEAALESSDAEDAEHSSASAGDGTDDAVMQKEEDHDQNGVGSSSDGEEADEPGPKTRARSRQAKRRGQKG
ncbi:hypothetical protein BDV18DRAFT_35642 [Aspergillus unguis]